MHEVWDNTPDNLLAEWLSERADKVCCVNATVYFTIFFVFQNVRFSEKMKMNIKSTRKSSFPFWKGKRVTF